MSLAVTRPRLHAAARYLLALLFAFSGGAALAQSDAPATEDAALAAEPVADATTPATEDATLAAEPVADATAPATADAALPAEPVADAPAAAADDNAAPQTADAVEAAPESVATIPVADTAPQQDVTVNEGGSKLETIQVTGSRLRRTDYETAQPVAVISRDEIERSGLTNIGDLLMRNTAAGSSINTTASTIFVSGGETNLDLRNLGSDRVLVLVNGRRWVRGLTSSSTSSVDLNTIPTAIIERVEILKDGASAVYGSDAIAGVVNIITRKDYRATEMSSQFGLYEQGDGVIQQHQLSWGDVFDTGTSVFANLSFTQQSTVKTTDRDIAKDGPGGKQLGRSRWNGIGSDGTFIFIPSADTYAQLGPDRCPMLELDETTGAGIPLCNITHTRGTPGASAADFHLNGTEDYDLFNRYLDSNVQNPNQRTALFVQATQDLLDNVKFSFEGLYNHNKASSQLRSQALVVGDLVGETSYISRTNIYNPFNQDIGLGTPPADTSVPTPNIVIPDEVCNLNPAIDQQVGCVVNNGATGAGLGVGTGAGLLRLLKFGPVRSEYETSTLRLGGGFDGDFSLADHFFTWDAGYSYAQNRRTETRFGDYNKTRMALALGPAANCTGDCVPLNVFDGQEGITQEMIDYLAVAPVNKSRNMQHDVYANFATDLPQASWLPLAAPVSVAFGVEVRRETYQDDPDMLLQTGQFSGNNAVATKGSTEAREAFVELGIPVLAGRRFAESLDLNLAGRVSSYKLAGTATTGKIGARWKPIDDILLRATYSGAFRAPSVGELFSGDTDSFDELSDPCVTPDDPDAQRNCAADGVPSGAQNTPLVTETRGGNRNLQPETARTLTAGFVLNPTALPDFSMTMDYYRIAIQNYITIAGGQFILDSCYNGEGRSYCQYVHRQGNGNLDYVEDRYVNFAQVETSGVDFNMIYRLPVPEDLGIFKLTLDTSYLEKYDQTLPVAGGGQQTSGQVGTASGFISLPRWKANTEITWKLGPISASWATRLVYRLTEDCVDPYPNILNNTGRPLSEEGVCSDPKFQQTFDSSGEPVYQDVSKNELPTHFYNDLQLGYALDPYQMDFALGVKNVLDEEPPFSYSPSVGGAYFNYNILNEEIPGRFVYLKIGKKF